ncbi:MAG TPA: cobalamin-dependent protein [Myxococcales bacterium]|nr:cobalamin-dependent protein [Myxococcales bacterium]
MSPQNPDGAASALRARYLAAQLKGDRREALRLIADEAGALGAEAMQLEVIQEAQREIGRLWEQNRITIAQEHMATAISQLALAQVYRDATAAPGNGKLVLVACVQGEQHAFPAQLVADRLELAGFDVRFLGADVPTSGLLEMIGQLEPDLLALSCAMPFHLPSLRDAVRRVRALPGPRLPILVGGNAVLTSSPVDEVDGTGRDSNEMITLSRRLLGLGS